jgi:hypothetical protein
LRKPGCFFRTRDLPFLPVNIQKTRKEYIHCFILSGLQALARLCLSEFSIVVSGRWVPVFVLGWRKRHFPTRKKAQRIKGVYQLDELVLEGIAGEFGVVLHVHLAEDLRPVGADGFDAQCQFAGNLADRFAGGDQAENLEFPV